MNKDIEKTYITEEGMDDLWNVWYSELHDGLSGLTIKVDRIIESSSNPGDIVTDYFAHSGTTLISAETLGRKCYTTDIDPIFCELTIRRLENYRKTSNPGWQNQNPFTSEI